MHESSSGLKLCTPKSSGPKMMQGIQEQDGRGLHIIRCEHYNDTCSLGVATLCSYFSLGQAHRSLGARACSGRRGAKSVLLCRQVCRHWPALYRLVTTFEMTETDLFGSDAQETDIVVLSEQASALAGFGTSAHAGARRTACGTVSLEGGRVCSLADLNAFCSGCTMYQQAGGNVAVAQAVLRHECLVRSVYNGFRSQAETAHNSLTV